jgi:amino acid transporter
MNMALVFLLLLASAILGLATSLFFRAWAMAPVSLLLAVASAIFLHADGFGFAGGVSAIIGCVVASQIAYVVGLFMTSRLDKPEDLTQDEVDGDPNNRGEQNVSDEDK